MAAGGRGAGRSGRGEAGAERETSPCGAVALHGDVAVLGLLLRRRGRSAGRLRKRPESGGVLNQAALVSQKILEISSIRSSSFWPVAGSTELFAPAAPAALVACQYRSWSCGYFSRWFGLK